MTKPSWAWYLNSPLQAQVWCPTFDSTFGVWYSIFGSAFGVVGFWLPQLLTFGYGSCGPLSDFRHFPAFNFRLTLPSLLAFDSFRLSDSTTFRLRILTSSLPLKLEMSSGRRPSAIEICWSFSAPSALVKISTNWWLLPMCWRSTSPTIMCSQTSW